jgi:phosphomannomutase
MRQLGEQFRERRQHTSDGLRIEIDDFWVLLSPDSDGPYIGVYAEGRDDAHAAELIRQYSELVQSMQ